jgi:hypothetical protein
MIGGSTGKSPGLRGQFCGFLALFSVRCVESGSIVRDGAAIRGENAAIRIDNGSQAAEGKGRC